ncbi:MAG: hypothetical protein QM654_11080 [Dysgonamonadaceae bacterium]
MKRILFSMLAIIILTSSCNVAQQAVGAYNMTKCEYSYNSIDNLTVSGVNLSQSLSPASILKLTALLTGNPSTLPLNMTLNINIKNPNTTAALLNGLSYIVSIDDIQFTTGQLDHSLNIASGASSVLPVKIGVDMATLMKNNSKDAIVNIAKNLAGISGNKSKVTLQLKPTFLIGSMPVTSPTYYPVSFSFGGK